MNFYSYQSLKTSFVQFSFLSKNTKNPFLRISSDRIIKIINEGKLALFVLFDYSIYVNVYIDF